jgi:porphobilinogen synthase
VEESLELTMQQLLDSLAERVRRPAVLEDRFMRLVAYSSHDQALDHVREDSILRRHASAEVKSWLTEFGLGTARRPFRLPANPELNMLPRVCVPVLHKDKVLGYLWFVDQDGSMSTADIEFCLREAAEIGGQLHRDSVASLFSNARLSGAMQTLLSDSPLANEAAATLEEAGYIAPNQGIAAVILFGIPAKKDDVGTENYSDDGIVQRAVRRIRERHPDLVLITDICCCEYTSHGHCGIVRDGSVDNDATLEILGRVGVSHARAGADIVAPSGMMDGMVAAIRSALDDAHFTEAAILSYAVKYASAFYGPFREAADSAPAFGDRRQYQMDPANLREALLEARLDEAEGADMLMVKPALAYLDVVRAVRERTELPLVAYNVSGEYAMVKAAARHGWIDECRVVLEALTGMRRAGADAIISYHAKDAAVWLTGESQ